ncbi:hypothetical protein E4U60_004982 [Claviceps pazoutovae]|uniref:Uncharacterized protein n=1 Tax=Claviceps pazoutovae TaxID=1649127 RepID=A0A9P7M845_9HYPO|nr:hypothetical protein E4U60_004982 [Claviceps pazoutovae]
MVYHGESGSMTAIQYGSVTLGTVMKTPKQFPAGDRVLATCVDANNQGRMGVQGGLRLKTLGDLIGRHVRQRPPPPLRLANGLYAA